MKKLLKDYPAREWMEAADGCQYCKAKYEARITWVDPAENVGDLEYKIDHKLDCPEVNDYFDGSAVTEFSSHDIAGWDYMEKPINFKGLKLYPLKARANVGPCLLCEKLVIRAPLILFIDEDGELDFCFGCAEEKGILQEALGR